MFKVLGIVMVASIVLGYVFRGGLERLANLRFKWVPVMLVSFALVLVPLFVSLRPWPSRIFILIANLGVLSFLVVNLPRQAAIVRVGLAILLLGWLLNVSAALANGGMPLSRWAWSQANQNHPPKITSGRGGFFKDVAAGPETSLRSLGDVIPLAPFHEVLSIGDFLLIFGIGVIIVAGMQTKAAEKPATAL
ncbi:MAG: DUF5317 family protein [Actinomycetota bacterium]